MAALFLLLAQVGGVKAESLDYSTSSMHAKGHVEIQNQFGKVTCEDAIMLLAEKPQPEKIVLKGKVFIALQDGSTVAADSAELNCETEEGTFRSIAPNQVVVTTVRPQPMKTEAKEIWIKIKKEKGKYILSDMKGEGTVQVEYMNEGSGK